MHALSALVVGLCALAAARASAEAVPGVDARIAAAIERFEAAVPERYFDEAFGYAVLPAVKRFGIGLGAAWGSGIVVEQGEVTGTARFWQATSGIQAGAALVSVIVFFRDSEAMDAFRCNTIEFMGQAGISVGPVGALKTPAYSSGVALFAAHRFGLMNEATVAIGKVSFHAPGETRPDACSASRRSGSVSEIP
jgi:hypothetical protein